MFRIFSLILSVLLFIFCAFPSLHDPQLDFIFQRIKDEPPKEGFVEGHHPW